MADQKLPNRSELTTPATGDLQHIVDVSDTTDSSDGTSKKITLQKIADWLASLAQTLTNKILTSPVINTGVSGTAIKDEDNMASDSDTAVPTQQSTKAYTDTQVATKIGDVVEDTTPQLGGDLGLNGKNIDFPTTANISDVLDEDNMASDSATKLATQQSIKKYVDDNAGGGVSNTTAKARAYLSSAQSIANNTAVLVELGAETYDPGSNFNVTAGNYKFVVPTTGYYQVSAAIEYGTTVANKRYSLWIRVNGVSKTRTMNQSAYNQVLSVTVSDILYLTADDYVQLYAYHQDTTTTPLTISENYTYLSIHLLSVD